MKRVLYRQMDVWARQDDSVTCYRIFKKLVAGRFAVQSADTFALPIDDIQVRQSVAQMIELLIESDLSDRETFYGTIEEAIERFDEDFQ